MSTNPVATTDIKAAVERQLASLHQSVGWLLTVIEPLSATVPPPGTANATRILRAARMLSWASPAQEALIPFAQTVGALEAEAAAEAPADDLPARIERAAAEALHHYMAMQNEGSQAEELSITSEAEEEASHRLRARADIGAAVRSKLARAGAERLGAKGLELYRVPDFLSPDECEALIGLIERDLFPSAVLGESGDETFRTSKSCNLQTTDAPVAAFEDKVADLLGINPRFSEPVQGQRYEVGQQFKPHHDFFHRGQSYYADAANRGGQRTWTAMLFLNQPERGGYTGFPQAGGKVPAKAGTLVIWNNMQPDGRPNPNSLHQGAPVEAGRKYVLTKWFRERLR